MKALHRLSLSGLICLCLAGCASYKDEPLSAQDNAARLQARSLSDPKLFAFLRAAVPDKFKIPPKQWSPEALELAGLYFNPSLEKARQQLAASKAAQTTAAALPNPTASLSPTYDATTPPPWILGLSFDIPIETAGKRGYRQAEAEDLSDAAIASLTASAWSVRSGVRSALLALYSAQCRHSLLVDQEAAESESARIFAEELKIGEVSPFEATQSEIALNQSRFALRDNEAEIVKSQARLAEAIGVDSTAMTGIQFDFSEFETYPPELADQKVRRYALVDRADIHAGLAAYDAAQSALQLEIARQYPDIHLGPGFLRDQGPSNIDGQYDNKWTLGVSFTLPIFNQNQGPIAEAEARRKQAAAEFDILQNRILSDVDQALSNYRSAIAKARAADELQSRLVGEVQVANRMLSLGEISPVELAQRKLELTNASLTQLDAMSGAQAALGGVEDTLQSPQSMAAVAADPISTDGGNKKPAVVDIGSVSLPGVKGGFDLMTVDLPNQRFFLDAEDNNTTEVIDLRTRTRLTEIGDMIQPKWAVYRPELNRLYVANGDGNIRVLDATTYKFLHAIHFREKANNLHFDPETGELFVGVGSTFGAIGIVDTRTDTIITEIPLAGSPNQFELNGNLIYVNVPSANQVAVIDRRRKAVIATWPLRASQGNYPMGIDRDQGRLFIGFQPGKLDVVDLANGREITTVDIAADADGVHYDEARRRIYVSCGAGWLYVVAQVDPDHYSVESRIATAEGAGTSWFEATLNQLFLPVPARGTSPAELRIYSVSAP